MKPPPSRNEALSQLALAFRIRDQQSLRSYIDQDEAYFPAIFDAYLRNPFLRLTDEEMKSLARVRPAGLGQLALARETAARSKAPRHCVFCMPKSGSSFVQSALQHALELPLATLTSFGTGRISSYFGMNSREQELDELAVVRSILSSPNGFVAQHHTRYSTYLALQLDLFGISPIVTVRNIYDCIVSFDDMMLQWRGGRANLPWVVDAQFALPSDYPALPAETRYTILAHSFGTWLINFYLSWKRSAEPAFVTPLVIRYEDDVLDGDRLVERLAGATAMTPAQRDRLAGYVRNPDRSRSRLNVGRSGRGAEKLPEQVRQFLADYAGLFRSELSPGDLAYLTA